MARTRKTDPHSYTPRPASVRAVRFILDTDRAVGNKDEIRDQLDVMVHVNRFRGEFHTASLQIGPYTWAGVNPGDWIVKHADGRLEVLAGPEFERRYTKAGEAA
ncbi:hypothetical protein [Rhodococcus ruber]|uniref:hypothetical protein n=2 Tax=Nocardiaceae TaxID=85025 RepID=UPI0011AB4504|nr:hypothetical protein [Rhodococcus ruber]